MQKPMPKPPLTGAVALRHGLGKHTKAIPPTDVKPYLLVSTCEETAYRLLQHRVLTLHQYTFLSELYYATDITLIKCSILCFYLRIFGVNRRFRLMCYGMIAFVVVWGVSVIFTTIFQCKPVRAGWDKTIPGEQCFNLEHFVIGTNVPNIIADAAVIALPVPLVWKLQLSRARKVGIVSVFLLAAL